MKTLFIPFLLLIFGSVSLVAQDLDSDFDGYSDAAETTAGTNPQSGLSFLTFSEIEVDEATGVAIPKWVSQDGVIYQVEVSQDLESWSYVLFAEAVSSASINLDDYNLVPTMANPSSRLFVRLNARRSPFDAPVLGQTWMINRSYVPGKSDRNFGPIGHRPAVFKGEVGNVLDPATSFGDFRYWITLKGADVMPAEGIEASFGECMIHVLSGDLEGSYYPVKSSLGMDLAIELGSLNVENDAPGLAVGDQIAIVPQWTLETQVGGVPNQTKVQIRHRVGNGVNRAAEELYTYYFSNNEWDGWYLSGASRLNRALAMDEAYTLRNNSTAACIQTSVGEVAGIGISHRLLKSEQAGVEEDQWITHTGALPLTIAELGALADYGDSIYLHNGSETGFNIAHTIKYTYWGSEHGWYDGGTPLDASKMVTPGSSFLLRRLAANNTGDRLWSYESGNEKPMASVAVTQSQGMEVTQEPIVFAVSSGGGHLEEVAFHYHLLGSFGTNEGSSDPSDYTVTDVNGNPLDGMVMVPPNGSTEIYVHPVADIINEYPEVVEIRLLMHADYDINPLNARARGTITDAPDTTEYEKVFVARYLPERNDETDAFGTALLVINGSNTIAWISTKFDNLTSQQTTAHIHHSNIANPNTAAGDKVMEDLSNGDFVRKEWEIKASGVYNVQNIIDALYNQDPHHPVGQLNVAHPDDGGSHHLYINIHTSKYTEGEIWGRFQKSDGAVEVTET